MTTTIRKPRKFRFAVIVLCAALIFAALAPTTASAASATLKPGSRVAIEFVLKDGRKLLGEFEVRKPAP